MSTVIAGTGVPAQLAAADWAAIAADLDAVGCAVTPRLLAPAQCRDLADLYDQPDRFRATIDMARHRFGSGQYRYFSHDLPGPVRALREAFYPHLLVIARDWASRLGLPRGRTPWRSGWRRATRPGRPRAPRSCCVTRPGTGTPCTATCSAIWFSRCRSSSGSMSMAPTTPAGSSCSSSSAPAPSPVAPPPS